MKKHNQDFNSVGRLQSLITSLDLIVLWAVGDYMTWPLMSLCGCVTLLVQVLTATRVHVKSEIMARVSAEKTLLIPAQQSPMTHSLNPNSMP